jgi:hypothetical protein
MSEKTLRKPVSFDELYPGRFLKAADLRGKHVTVRIADIALEELEGEKGAKVSGIIFLHGTDKQIVLNRTNGYCLKAMFGKTLSDWIGKRVTIKPDTTKLGRDTVDCIRIHGSPDIAEDMKATITLPRRKPFDMTMHAVGKEAAPATETVEAGAP